MRGGVPGCAQIAPVRAGSIRMRAWSDRMRRKSKPLRTASTPAHRWSVRVRYRNSPRRVLSTGSGPRDLRANRSDPRAPPRPRPYVSGPDGLRIVFVVGSISYNFLRSD